MTNTILEVLSSGYEAIVHRIQSNETISSQMTDFISNTPNYRFKRGNIQNFFVTNWEAWLDPSVAEHVCDLQFRRKGPHDFHGFALTMFAVLVQISMTIKAYAEYPNNKHRGPLMKLLLCGVVTNICNAMAHFFMPNMAVLMVWNIGILVPALIDFYSSFEKPVLYDYISRQTHSYFRYASYLIVVNFLFLPSFVTMAVNVFPASISRKHTVYHWLFLFWAFMFSLFVAYEGFITTNCSLFGFQRFPIHALTESCQALSVIFGTLHFIDYENAHKSKND